MFSSLSVGLISVSPWQILSGPHSVAFAVMTAATMYCAAIISAAITFASYDVLSTAIMSRMYCLLLPRLLQL